MDKFCVCFFWCNCDSFHLRLVCKIYWVWVFYSVLHKFASHVTHVVQANNSDKLNKRLFFPPSTALPLPPSSLICSTRLRRVLLALIEFRHSAKHSPRYRLTHYGNRIWTGLLFIIIKLTLGRTCPILLGHFLCLCVIHVTANYHHVLECVSLCDAVSLHDFSIYAIFHTLNKLAKMVTIADWPMK